MTKTLTDALVGLRVGVGRVEGEVRARENHVRVVSGRLSSTVWFCIMYVRWHGLWLWHTSSQSQPRMAWTHPPVHPSTKPINQSKPQRTDAFPAPPTTDARDTFRRRSRALPSAQSYDSPSSSHTKAKGWSRP